MKMKINNIQTFGFEKAAKIANSKNDSAYYADIIWNEENKFKYKFNTHLNYDYYFDKDTLALLQLYLTHPGENETLKYIIAQGEMEIPYNFLTKLLILDKESTYTIESIFSQYNFVNDFEFDSNKKNWNLPIYEATDIRWMQLDIETYCKILYDRYVETNNYGYYKALCDITPCAKLVKIYFTTNYSSLRKLYSKIPHIDEWKLFINFINELPYGKELILYQGDER